MKICILYGGTSSERNVSLNTGKSIYDTICNEHEVTMYDFNGNYDLLLGNVENVDLVFNALHGGSGEDGTMQKYLESKDIKFTGSSSKASEIAMDKNITKLIARSINIKTPKWILLKKDNHEVKIFDTTYYSTDHGNNSDGTKEEGLNVVPFSEALKKKGMTPKNSRWQDDVKKQVENFFCNSLILSSLHTNTILFLEIFFAN